MSGIWPSQIEPISRVRLWVDGHNHRSGHRLVQGRDPKICLSFVWWSESMPRRLTHALSFVFRWCTLPRQCCLLCVRVLLKVPLWVLQESYAGILTMNILRHLLNILIPIIMDFFTSKSSSNRLSMLVPPRTSFRTSWTFLDVLVLNFIIDLYSLNCS